MNHTTNILLVVLWCGAGLMVLAPSTSAHDAGCAVVAHMNSPGDKNGVHAFCGQNPNTCFSNLQRGGIQVHAGCLEPDHRPCLMKAQVQGDRATLCVPQEAP